MPFSFCFAPNRFRFSRMGDPRLYKEADSNQHSAVSTCQKSFNRKGREGRKGRRLVYVFARGWSHLKRLVVCCSLAYFANFAVNFLLTACWRRQPESSSPHHSFRLHPRSLR